MPFEPVPKHKMGEQPLFVQKWKLKRAKNRGCLFRILRCVIGIHNPPYNEPTDDMGAIIIGGSCTRCDNEVWREVTWIGNAWDFVGAVRQQSTSGGIIADVNHYTLEERVHDRMEELLS